VGLGTYFAMGFSNLRCHRLRNAFNCRCFRTNTVDQARSLIPSPWMQESGTDKDALTLARSNGRQKFAVWRLRSQLGSVSVEFRS
jgi:hypothetical protein